MPRLFEEKFTFTEWLQIPLTSTGVKQPDTQVHDMKRSGVCRIYLFGNCCSHKSILWKRKYSLPKIMSTPIPCPQSSQKNLRRLAQHATTGNRIHYERQRPEQNILCQLVQQHVETFFAQVEAETGSGLPGFVKDEFDAFLECGILAHGFLRLRCADCAHEKLVAFFLQATRILSFVRWAAHGVDGCPLGRSHHSPGAGAPMGTLAVCKLFTVPSQLF